MSEQLCKNILKETGRKIASGSELSELQDAQRRYDLALDGLTTFNRANAYNDFVLHQRDLIEAVKSGTAKGLDAWTLADYEQDYTSKEDSCRESMRQICQDVLPLAGKICKRFVEVAERFSADSTAAEIELHRRLGVTYRASGLVLALQKAADFARARCPNVPAAAYSPKNLLPYLDL